MPSKTWGALVSLVCWFIVMTAEAADETKDVAITSRKVFSQLDKNFISFSIDPEILLKHHFNSLEHSRMMAMAQSVAPAYLRLAGPRTSKYHLTQTSYVNNSVSEAELAYVSSFAKQVGFTLILAFSPEHRTFNNSWDGSEARRALQITNRAGVMVAAQLGFERFRTEHHNGKQLGKDTMALANVLRSVPKYREALVLGPDISSIEVELQGGRLTDLVEASKNTLSAITWHPRSLHTFIDEFTLRRSNDLEKVMIRACEAAGTIGVERRKLGDVTFFSTADSIPLWLGESNNPIPQACFVDAIMWASRLGEAANLDVKVVLQDLSTDMLINPSPTFWVTVLHRQLMSDKVLQTVIHDDEEDEETMADDERRTSTHVYCNCARKGQATGSITLLVVNYHSKPNNLNVKVHWTGSVSKLGVRKFILTGENSPLSSTVLLNGRRLNLLPNGGVPTFEGEEAVIPESNRRTVITVPPHSVSFWVFSMAYAKACMPQYSEVPDTASSGSKHLRKKRDLTAQGNEIQKGHKRRRPYVTADAYHQAAPLSSEYTNMRNDHEGKTKLEQCDEKNNEGRVKTHYDLHDDFNIQGFHPNDGFQIDFDEPDYSVQHSTPATDFGGNLHESENHALHIKKGLRYSDERMMENFEKYFEEVSREHKKYLEAKKKSKNLNYNEVIEAEEIPRLQLDLKKRNVNDKIIRLDKVSDIGIASQVESPTGKNISHAKMIDEKHENRQQNSGAKLKVREPINPYQQLFLKQIREANKRIRRSETGATHFEYYTENGMERVIVPPQNENVEGKNEAEINKRNIIEKIGALNVNAAINPIAFAENENKLANIMNPQKISLVKTTSKPPFTGMKQNPEKLQNLKAFKLPSLDDIRKQREEVFSGANKKLPTVDIKLNALPNIEEVIHERSNRLKTLVQFPTPPTHLRVKRDVKTTTAAGVNLPFKALDLPPLPTLPLPNVGNFKERISVLPKVAFPTPTLSDVKGLDLKGLSGFGALKLPAVALNQYAVKGIADKDVVVPIFAKEVNIGKDITGVSGALAKKEILEEALGKNSGEIGFGKFGATKLVAPEYDFATEKAAEALVAKAAIAELGEAEAEAATKAVVVKKAAQTVGKFAFPTPALSDVKGLDLKGLSALGALKLPAVALNQYAVKGIADKDVVVPVFAKEVNIGKDITVVSGALAKKELMEEALGKNSGEIGKFGAAKLVAPAYGIATKKAAEALVAKGAIAKLGVAKAATKAVVAKKAAETVATKAVIEKLGAAKAVTDIGVGAKAAEAVAIKGLLGLGKLGVAKKAGDALMLGKVAKEVAAKGLITAKGLKTALATTPLIGDKVVENVAEKAIEKKVDLGGAALKTLLGGGALAKTLSGLKLATTKRRRRFPASEYQPQEQTLTKRENARVARSQNKLTAYNNPEGEFHTKDFNDWDEGYVPERGNAPINMRQHGRQNDWNTFNTKNKGGMQVDHLPGYGLHAPAMEYTGTEDLERYFGDEKLKGEVWASSTEVDRGFASRQLYPQHPAHAEAEPQGYSRDQHKITEQGVRGVYTPRNSEDPHNELIVDSYFRSRVNSGYHDRSDQIRNPYAMYDVSQPRFIRAQRNKRSANEHNLHKNSMTYRFLHMKDLPVEYNEINSNDKNLSDLDIENIIEGELPPLISIHVEEKQPQATTEPPLMPSATKMPENVRVFFRKFFIIPMVKGMDFISHAIRSCFASPCVVNAK